MNKRDDVYLKGLLEFDAFSTAEKVTKESYKEDKLTEAIGVGMFFENNRAKEAQLLKMGDTTFHNKLDRYLSIVNDLGFELALETPFTKTDHYSDGPHVRNEKHFVFWRPDGLLLVFDTYTSSLDGIGVNGGSVYYNWQAPSYEEISKAWSYLSSHDPFSEDNTCAGHFDCREGLRFNIRKLEEFGKFLNPWTRPGFVWLRHHGDPTYEYRKDDGIEKERFLQLPEHVRNAIKISRDWSDK